MHVDRDIRQAILNGLEDPTEEAIQAVYNEFYILIHLIEIANYRRDESFYRILIKRLENQTKQYERSKKNGSEEFISKNACGTE